MEEVADEEVVAFMLAIAFAHGVVDAWEDDEFEVLAGTDESIGFVLAPQNQQQLAGFNPRCRLATLIGWSFKIA